MYYVIFFGGKPIVIIVNEINLLQNPLIRGGERGVGLISDEMIT